MASKSNAALAKVEQLPAVNTGLLDGPIGADNISHRDLLVPRITILQGLSPQLTRSKPEYIPEARPGNFCDVSTGDIFADELLVLPCAYMRTFLEWAPRNSGRGLVANHGKNEEILKQATFDGRKFVLPNGNLIAETPTFYILNLSAGGRRSFIPMSSTQVKNARRWLTALLNQRVARSDGSSFNPPLFYRSWRATPMEQSNNDGSWYGWRFEPGSTVLEDRELEAFVPEAKAFRDLALSGALLGDFSAHEPDHSVDTAPF